MVGWIRFSEFLLYEHYYELVSFPSLLSLTHFILSFFLLLWNTNHFVVKDQIFFLFLELQITTSRGKWKYFYSHIHCKVNLEYCSKLKLIYSPINLVKKINKPIVNDQ